MPRLDERRLDDLPAPISGQIDYWDPALPGFGLRVSQGGTRAWVIMVRQAGRKRRITLGSYPRISLTDARAKCRALLALPHAPAQRDRGGYRTGPRGMGGAREAAGLASGIDEAVLRFARLLERTPLPVLVVQDGLIGRANTAAAALLAAEAPAALLGRALLDFVHPADRAAVIHRQADSSTQTSEGAPPLRLRFFRLDGSAISATATIAPLSGRSAGPLAIVVADPRKEERTAPHFAWRASEPAISASAAPTGHGHATQERLLAKTISWRVTTSLNTFAIASIITGRLEFGAFIAGAEFLATLLLRYLHERVWAYFRGEFKPERPKA